MDKAYDRMPTLHSRHLRSNPTIAEKKLWTVLRNRQLVGVRFNRQVPVGPYICDFVARSPRLIVEVDGGRTLLTNLATRRERAFCGRRATASSASGTMMFWRISMES